MAGAQFTTTQVLTNVGVHASAMSIFLGIFGLYVIYHHRRRHELQERIFRAARQINEISSPPSFSLPGTGIYDGRSAENREELRRRLTKLAMGVPDQDLPPSHNKIERGAEAFRVMSALLHYYPFPQRAEPTDEGGISIGAISEVAFDDIEDVRGWLAEVDSLTSDVEWITRAHGAKLKRILDAASESEKYDHRQSLDTHEMPTEHMSAAAVEDMKRSMSTADRPMTELFGQPFFQLVERAAEVAQETRERLEEFNVYQSQRPHWGWIVGATVLAVTGFSAGVIAPLLNPSIPAWVLLGIPITVYGIAFVALIIFAGQTAAQEAT